MLKTYITELSLSPNLYFYTFKALTKKPRHQTIGWASDHMKKISNHYYIVREKNLATDGFHFHVICSRFKEPHKGWFIKGMHINTRKVGDKKPRVPDYPLSQDEDLHNQELERERLKPLNEDEHLIDQAASKHKTSVLRVKGKIRKIAHVERLVVYMNKDCDVDGPKIQYTSFIYVNKPPPS